MGCGPLLTEVNQLDRAKCAFLFYSLNRAATQRVFIVDTIPMISLKIVLNSKHYYLDVLPVSYCLVFTSYLFSCIRIQESESYLISIFFLSKIGVQIVQNVEFKRIW